MKLLRNKVSMACAVAAVASTLALGGGTVLAADKPEQAGERGRPEQAGEQGKAFGRNRNLGHNSARDGIKARIVTDREVFYTGDLLEIGVRFPRGADKIQEEGLEAHLLIFDPAASISALPLTQEVSESGRTLFRIQGVDPETLPEGVYQLGVVITEAGGDPLDVSTWYNGLLGLITVRGLTVSDGFLPEDTDGDGHVDDDDDGDGIDDGENETVEDEEPAEEEGSGTI